MSYCTECGEADGVHEPGCRLMSEGWERTMNELSPRRSLCEALEARGYSCLFAVGFGERPDGTYSIKIAARPQVRKLRPETWQSMRTTMIGAFDRLMASELDDLELE